MNFLIYLPINNGIEERKLKVEGIMSKSGVYYGLSLTNTVTREKERKIFSSFLGAVSGTRENDCMGENKGRTFAGSCKKGLLVY